jgi:tRNA-uridine 2-sulfurtransferase
MKRAANAGATVAVAMSGGVDSSVAAAMLAGRGFNVIGLTMRLFCYSETQQSAKSCCNIQAIADARGVCEQLGVPHYVIDCGQEFERDVISRFVASYLAGQTPNPCVDCNSFIKFDFLLRKAVALGADYLATGHYVRLAERGGRPCLLRGVDSGKDQSYFLWGIGRAALEKLLFPLGDYSKPEVRGLAEKYEIAAREKAESQEICFVENDSVEQFIRAYTESLESGGQSPVSTKPGPVLDSEGREVGRHRGSAFYTIGQRKGLGVALGRPVYVTRIDTEHNVIVVGDVQELNSGWLIAGDVNILADIPEDRFRSSVQIRYRQRPVMAEVERTGKNTVRVELEQPQRSVARGQSVVFYDGDLVLGGAVISDCG